METADNFDPQLQNELLTMETNICKVVIALYVAILFVCLLY